MFTRRGSLLLAICPRAAQPPASWSLASVQRSALPCPLQHSAPSHSLQRSAPPHSLQRSAPPHSLQRSAPLHSFQSSVLLRPFQWPAPSHSRLSCCGSVSTPSHFCHGIATYTPLRSSCCGPPSSMPVRDRSCASCGSPQRRGSNSQPKSPFMIGVAGGTASGKTTVCKSIMDQLGQTEINNIEKQVVALSQDSFYKELTSDEILLAHKGKFNFDHPDAFDYELLYACLKDIKEGRPTKVPVYDFKHHSRVPGEFINVYPSDVVLVEGILVFYFPVVRDMFQMKLFVDTDADTRLARRVLRDIEERGRDLEQVLTQYTTLVKPAFEEFCIPTKKFADVIVPRGADNTVAINLIVQHIRDIIWRCNGQKAESPLSRSRSNSDSRIR